MKQVYSWPPSSRTPAAMTLAWGAKVRGRWCHPGPIFCRPLRVKGPFCARTGRTAFLFRRNLLECGIGSDIQRPLATVVVGGLLSTLFLTLLALPAVYWLVSRRRQQAAQ